MSNHPHRRKSDQAWWRSEVFKFAVWVAGAIATAVTAYVTLTDRVQAIEKQVADGAVLQQGTVGALQDVQKGLEAILTRLKQHDRDIDRHDREFERLRNYGDGRHRSERP